MLVHRGLVRRVCQVALVNMTRSLRQLLVVWHLA